ncbi:hypothetical protein A2U01_0105967 [Trifolium medium]|uniref:Uncharacterized protein n=1 Tax=Trifolium medium TaxID=97028 RepID=A0A392VBR9_9FABA|nr:hypothetical protein [Trifolium medium]
MCEAKHVPQYPGDERLYSVKALMVGQYREYDKKKDSTRVVEADDMGGN